MGEKLWFIGKNIFLFKYSHAGISRSSTIILSYLIKYKKMKFDDALNLIREKREKINPNPGFVKQLREYEKECLGQS